MIDKATDAVLAKYKCSSHLELVEALVAKHNIDVVKAMEKIQELIYNEYLRMAK